MKIMKKYIFLIFFLFVGLNEVYTQNMSVSGATTSIVNGYYITSNPLLSDGVFYYIKVGTPTLYLYRTESAAWWMIGQLVDSDDITFVYYYLSSGNATPDGLTLTKVGNLGSLPEYPNINDTSLPVELSSFTIEATNQGVLCKWTTESEIENLGFILERKTEGTGWKEIANYKTDNNLMGHGSTSSATDYEYLDTIVEPNTTYEYRLADVDYDGVVTYHSVRTVTIEKAPLSSKIDEFTVMPAYPNPFNPSTTITYGINEYSKVIIDIYDIAGQLINTLQDGYQSKGWHSVDWNGTDKSNNQVPTGIYLSKVTSGDKVKTTKLMLLK